jgi:hypothetical protein
MFEQAEEGIIRENARVRLQILDSLDVRDALAAAVAEYERRQGRRPGRLDRARGRGPLARAAQDAAGYAFGYDPLRDGSSSRTSRRCGGRLSRPENTIMKLPCRSRVALLAACVALAAAPLRPRRRGHRCRRRRAT